MITRERRRLALFSLLKLSSYFIYNFKGTWGEASLYTALGANVYFNYNHTKGDCEFQPQMILGAKYAY